MGLRSFVLQSARLTRSLTRIGRLFFLYVTRSARKRSFGPWNCPTEGVISERNRENSCRCRGPRRPLRRTSTARTNAYHRLGEESSARRRGDPERGLALKFNRFRNSYGTERTGRKMALIQWVAKTRNLCVDNINRLHQLNTATILLHKSTTSCTITYNLETKRPTTIHDSVHRFRLMTRALTVQYIASTPYRN